MTPNTPLDPGYAAKLGVNTEDLLVSQPDTGEQALEITDMLVRSAAVDVVVIDSVAALTPKAEIEGDMGDSHMGLQARLMSQALRKLTANIKRSNTMVIFINQIRMKIGVMFGNPETTTGGNALKFYSSVRLDIRRIGAIKKGDEILGNQTRVKVVKNKVAPPFRKAEFDILYNEGISKEGELIDLGIELGVVEKSGAWYSYGADRVGQGRDNVREFLKENPDIAAAIEAKVRAEKGLDGGGGADAAPTVAKPAAAKGAKAEVRGKRSRGKRCQSGVRRKGCRGERTRRKGTRRKRSRGERGLISAVRCRLSCRIPNRASSRTSRRISRLLPFQTSEPACNCATRRIGCWATASTAPGSCGVNWQAKRRVRNTRRRWSNCWLSWRSRARNRISGSPSSIVAEDIKTVAGRSNSATN